MGRDAGVLVSSAAVCVTSRESPGNSIDAGSVRWRWVELVPSVTETQSAPLNKLDRCDILVEYQPTPVLKLQIDACPF